MSADSPPRDSELARALDVLGSPVRLAILRRLRVPKALTEVRVRVRPARGGDTDRPRTLARQTVKEHLDKLLSLGVVVTREGRRDHGPVTEYLIDHRRLYALADELRELALLRPTAEASLATVDAPTKPPAATAQGPALVVVKGLEEGQTFPLASPGGQPRTWTIGRRRDGDIALDYDPYVSGRHARVRFDGEGFLLEDLESRNGTDHNFHPLSPDEAAPLEAGDVVGVGRSLLVARI